MKGKADMLCKMLVFSAAVGAAFFVSAQEPAPVGDTHVLEGGAAVKDRRALTTKHTNTVFTMPEFRNKKIWQNEAEIIRTRMLIGSGLWPMPERTPLNAKVFEPTEHEDYIVEKVQFEAYPGFLVTGNLYRPKGEGPFPGVINPHGHWEKGRLENSERGSVPGRCITFARLGMVAFSYDMIGYVDSQQFPHNWGTEKEKLWGIHPFALQLWSSVRAVDFLESLPYVDRNNIACTGASGGGTQTFALTAIDPRVKVSAPVNMISGNMQGGCLCENAPIIRIGHSNMEIGAMMAPRPMLMVSATGDWTRETPRVEYPAIRSIYALYGAENNLEQVQVTADHNYNQPSREAVYRFFGKHVLRRTDMAEYVEPAFEVDADEKLRLFADATPPVGFPTGDEVVTSLIERKKAVLAAEDGKGMCSDQRAQWQALRSRQGGALLALTMGVEPVDANAFDSERVSREVREGYALERWVISRGAVRDAVPALFYRSVAQEPQAAVLLVHGDGKAALSDTEKGGPGALIQGLMAQGYAVLSIDTFLTGEHHPKDGKTERLVEGKFSDTFQPTDTGYRVQDIVTALGFLRARRDITGVAGLAGLGQAGVWALLASAIDQNVPVTVVDFNNFDATSDDAWVAQYYVPCIRGIGDIKTAVNALRPRGKSLPEVVVYNGGSYWQGGAWPKYVQLAEGAPEAGALLEVLKP